MKRDGLVYTVIFSFITAFAFVFILSLAYGATKGKVEENARITGEKAYLAAAGFEVSASMTPSEIDSMFREKFPGFKEDAPYSETAKDGKQIIVSPFSGNGLWGTISGVIGVSRDVKRMVGISIISHNETPGLGGRIEEKWFLDQFKGEDISGGIKIRRGGGEGDKDLDNGAVDGITGASRTSSALEVIINKKIDMLRKELGGTD